MWTWRKSSSNQNSFFFKYLVWNKHFSPTICMFKLPSLKKRKSKRNSLSAMPSQIYNCFFTYQSCFSTTSPVIEKVPRLGTSAEAISSSSNLTRGASNWWRPLQTFLPSKMWSNAIPPHCLQLPRRCFAVAGASTRGPCNPRRSRPNLLALPAPAPAAPPDMKTFCVSRSRRKKASERTASGIRYFRCVYLWGKALHFRRRLLPLRGNEQLF